MVVPDVVEGAVVVAAAVEVPVLEVVPLVVDPVDVVVAALVPVDDRVVVAPCRRRTGRRRGGFASWPLSASASSICCCTAATWAAIAAGVPFAPSAESAFSCCSAACDLLRRAPGDGCDVSVTTIWSAIAVVRHAGQLTLSAPAALIGAIVLLCADDQHDLEGDGDRRARVAVRERERAVRVLSPARRRRR